MGFHDIRQDVVVAWRGLRSNPGYAAVVVLTLALGIAAVTMVFSFMNPYFVRELPFGEPGRLVQLGQVEPVRGWDGVRFSLAQFRDWKRRSRAFEDLAAYSYTIKNLTGTDEPERVVLGLLSANMFQVLQVEAAPGRTFLPGEEGPGGADVVVLSHGLWQRRFGGDPDILGQTIRLDGVSHEVIGVMPRDFNFPFGGVKLWAPIRESAATEARERNIYLPVGRLNPGWTRERARGELEAIQRDLGLRYPEIDGRFSGVSVKPLREALNFAYEIMYLSFLVFLAAVGFVLLIACVNVASLTLARTAARSREVALRAALGASRSRLVRQLLAEGALLAVAGGVLGTALAHWGARTLAPLVPEDLFRVGEVGLDGTVLAFSLAVTLTTPLLFALAPAVSAARANLARALKEGGRGVGTGLQSARGRRALVVFEVAMAIVLIGATGLS